MREYYSKIHVKDKHYEVEDQVKTFNYFEAVGRILVEGISAGDLITDGFVIAAYIKGEYIWSAMIIVTFQLSCFRNYLFLRLQQQFSRT